MDTNIYTELTVIETLTELHHFWNNYLPKTVTSVRGARRVTNKYKGTDMDRLLSGVIHVHFMGRKKKLGLRPELCYQTFNFFQVVWNLDFKGKVLLKKVVQIRYN